MDNLATKYVKAFSRKQTIVLRYYVVILEFQDRIRDDPSDGNQGVWRIHHGFDRAYCARFIKC